jgi:hypothetical protein
MAVHSLIRSTEAGREVMQQPARLFGLPDGTPLLLQESGCCSYLDGEV